VHGFWWSAELNKGARVLVVGEAPGEQEEKYQRPFVGPSGTELDRALRAGGKHRGHVALTNAILCRPPENDLKKLIDVQRRHMKLTGEVQKTPTECCAPRLERELDQYDNYLPLGKTGAAAVTNQTSSILAIRGAGFTLTHKGQEKKVLPTLHPAFVPSGSSMVFRAGRSPQSSTTRNLMSLRLSSPTPRRSSPTISRRTASSA
jgi:DNA polymerase